MRLATTSRVLQEAEARFARRFERSRDARPFLPPNPDLPVGPDTLSEIRHIVVLMMENHSFDNYLGVLGRGDGLPLDVDGKSNARNPTTGGEPIASRHSTTTKQHPRVPSQSWEASHEQWATGATTASSAARNANALAGGPGMVAARLRPAPVLRTE